MQNNYTSRTASLKATIADVKKLDAKSIDAQSIKINGKPVGTGVTDIRKGNSTPYDLWPNGVREENGATVVYPLGHNKIDISTLSDDVKNHYKHKVANIVDNVCYDKNNNIISYIDTLAIEDGTNLFYPSPGTPINFININIDLSNLICGKQMFKGRGNTKSVTANFDKLIDGYAMFHSCANLESVQGTNFNSLLSGGSMFYGCNRFNPSNLEFKKLSYADSMFSYCTSLKTFAIDLPNLVRASGMFWRK